ncbi:MAG: 3-oxoacyl-[acyl-carrier-protein] reductase [Acidobacteria bacterium]|nr:MAG: 3-oxoacyl-[acyl-carrier-protein] reductase [Acidobacteriota bacterium]
MKLLDGRVAIITGASKGIGRVMSQLFAREGAKVVCAARSEALVNETATLINSAASIKSAGASAIAVVADAGSEAGAKAIVDAGLRAFDRIDTLVNNAGDGGPTKPVQDYTVDDWYYTVNSCLTSSYLCIRFAVPAMIAAGGGAIVNIASMAGRRGLAYRIGYCSAKAGQIGMTYGLALELGRHNITVNAIAPGAVEGDRIDRVIKGQAEVRGVDVERMRQWPRPKTSRRWRRFSAAATRVISAGNAYRSLPVNRHDRMSRSSRRYKVLSPAGHLSEFFGLVISCLGGRKDNGSG